MFCHNYIIVNTMKLTDKRFWIAWMVMAMLMVVILARRSWNEDMIILSIFYALSLLSTWLCHRIRPKAALGNLLVMFLYNLILWHNFSFNIDCGSGFIWWSCLLDLNAIHSIGLLIYTLIIRFIKKHH